MKYSERAARRGAALRVRATRSIEEAIRSSEISILARLASITLAAAISRAIHACTNPIRAHLPLRAEGCGRARARLRGISVKCALLTRKYRINAPVAGKRINQKDPDAS